MVAQAEERKKQQEKLLEEDRLAKLKKLEAKKQLKHIQDLDKQDKQQIRSRMGEIDKNTKDFGDHNVFSYVYTTKEH